MSHIHTYHGGFLKELQDASLWRHEDGSAEAGAFVGPTLAGLGVRWQERTGRMADYIAIEEATVLAARLRC